MPDLTVVSPAAVVPADRLILGATDARGIVTCSPSTPGMTPFCNIYCTADD